MEFQMQRNKGGPPITLFLWTVEKPAKPMLKEETSWRRFRCLRKRGNVGLCRSKVAELQAVKV